MNKRSVGLSEGAIKRLTCVFSEIPDLDAAYLFGSAARRGAAGTGDVDLAVLCRREPDLEFTHKLLSTAQDELERDDIDLILLNHASPIMSFEAISGQRLVMNSPTRVTAFESLVAREYEDEMARIAAARAMGVRRS